MSVKVVVENSMTRHMKSIQGYVRKYFIPKGRYSTHKQKESFLMSRNNY